MKERKRERERERERESIKIHINIAQSLHLSSGLSIKQDVVMVSGCLFTRIIGGGLLEVRETRPACQVTRRRSTTASQTRIMNQGLI